MREPLIEAVEAGRRGAEPDLARYLMGAAARTPKAAEIALNGLADAAPRTWLRLDLTMRSWTVYDRSGADGGTGPLAALIAACSRDGRRREEALTRACFATDRRLLPILVVRTADWVRPVRQRARAVLARALAEPPTLTSVGVALEMRDWSRGDHAIAVTREALRDVPDARSARHVPIRRLAYDLWLEDATRPLDEIADAALTETDPVSRLRCAERVAEGQDVAALERLLGSRSVPVQDVALTALVKLGRPQHGLPYLTARSSPLRATAQWAARRLGEDPLRLYRELEPDEPDTRGHVAGLGELGTSEDLGLIEPYLEYPRPHVRAEAVRAFHRLGGPARRLGPMFTDPAPAVVRAVSRALRGDSAALPTDGLRDLLADRRRPPHVRHAAFIELAVRDPWTRAEAGLLSLSDDDRRLADLARADLTNTHWTSAAQYAAVPSDEVRERVRGLIDAAATELGEHRVRWLRWSLGLHR